MIEDEI